MAETMAAAVTSTVSSASSRNNNQPTIHQLNISVLRATIDPSLITKKPSPYVEISVDGKFVRKTEFVKNTNEPNWSNEIHTLLVTPASKCLLRIYSHSTFRRDTVLGEGRLDIQKQLVRVQGKFDKTSLIIDIKGEPKNTHGAPPPANGRSTRVKVGELFIVLDGMKVDHKLLQTSSSSRNSARVNGEAGGEIGAEGESRPNGVAAPAAATVSANASSDLFLFQPPCNCYVTSVQFPAKRRVATSHVSSPLPLLR